MIRHLESLYNCHCHIGPSIQLPNGGHVPVTHIGSLTFNFDFHLNVTLHVPSFKFNLLSASKITKTLHCSIQFFFFDYFFSGPENEESDLFDYITRWSLQL